MINATGATPSSFIDSTPLVEHNNTPPQSSFGNSGAPIEDIPQKKTPSNPKKSNIKLILGALVLMIVVVGGAAGFYLSQQSGVGDTRQQAYTPGEPEGCCASDSDCPAGETCSVPNGACGGVSGVEMSCKAPDNSIRYVCRNNLCSGVVCGPDGGPDCTDEICTSNTQCEPVSLPTPTPLPDEGGGGGCNSSLGYDNCDNLCSYSPPVVGVCECCEVTTNQCVWKRNAAGVCVNDWYTPGSEWFCGADVGTVKDYTCEPGWFTDSNCQDNTGSSQCSNVVSCNQNESWCSPPTPTPTPTPTTVASPTPTPIAVGPMCNNISMTNLEGIDLPSTADSTFIPGQTSVRFRCGADLPALVDHYEFRVTAPSGALTTLVASTTALSDDPYLIEETGTYEAQCRVCTTDGCLPYEGDAGESMPVPTGFFFF